MKHLFRVIHAAHCKSTHHKLAIDALRYLKGQGSKEWQRLFLKYHEPYLTGAKDPDKKFKDFRNHVLHVEDNYWGGAVKTTRKWYDTTVNALRQGDWEGAVYSFGVMSHYYTDPLMPFHTGQTERENNIHRAAEWSVCKSYDDIRDLGELVIYHPDVSTNSGDDWLEEMVRQGAEYSHSFYNTFLDHYDFDRGSKRPKEGLDATCKEFLSKLLGHAAIGTARILERAIAESGAVAPSVSLSLETLFLTIQVPFRLVARHIEDSEERAVIETIYNEWKQTGKVTLNLSEDDRMIEELYAAEVEYQGRQSRSSRRRSTTQRTQVVQQRSQTVQRKQPVQKTSSSWQASKIVRDDSSHQTTGHHQSGNIQSKAPAPAQQIKSVESETSQLLGAIESIEADLENLDVENLEQKTSSQSTFTHMQSQHARTSDPVDDIRDNESRSVESNESMQSLYESTKNFDSNVRSISDNTQDQSHLSSSSSSHSTSRSRDSQYDQDSNRSQNRDNDRDSDSQSSSRSQRRTQKSSSRDNDYDRDSNRSRSSSRSQSRRERDSNRSSERSRSYSSSRSDRSGSRRSSDNETESNSESTLRFYLKTTDDVEAGPSIGPKTANRLYRVGIRTVTDLLNANPEEIAQKINKRHIEAETIRDWQDQARLICCIPQVRGHDVQILVACGYRTVADVASSNDQQLFHLVNQFTGTSEGQRIIRSGKSPDLLEIQEWICWANQSRSLNKAA